MRNIVQCDDCREVAPADENTGWMSLTLWQEGKTEGGGWPFFGAERNRDVFDFCSVECLESWTQARRLIGEVSK